MWLMWYLLAILFVPHTIVVCRALESSDLDSIKPEVPGEQLTPLAPVFGAGMLRFVSV
jgi:hypothetical protein